MDTDKNRDKTNEDNTGRRGSDHDDDGADDDADGRNIIGYACNEEFDGDDGGGYGEVTEGGVKGYALYDEVFFEDPAERESKEHIYDDNLGSKATSVKSGTYKYTYRRIKIVETCSAEKMEDKKMNWQIRYFRAIDMDRDTPEKAIKRAKAIQLVQEEFTEVASKIGKTIISESFMRNEDRTIPVATEVGGVAGGEKYIAHGILFKYAVDSKGIYGTDTFAAKAAGNEMRALRAVQNFSLQEQQNCFQTDQLLFAEKEQGQAVVASLTEERSDGSTSRTANSDDSLSSSSPYALELLNAPLVQLINFMGHRLIASALLPIRGSSTLRYGTGDVAWTIVDDGLVDAVL
eukprot:g2440.t1